MLEKATSFLSFFLFVIGTSGFLQRDFEAPDADGSLSYCLIVTAVLFSRPAVLPSNRSRSALPPFCLLTSPFHYNYKILSPPYSLWNCKSSISILFNTSSNRL